MFQKRTVLYDNVQYSVHFFGKKEMRKVGFMGGNKKPAFKKSKIDFNEGRFMYKFAFLCTKNDNL
jgi:hypothetical protein